MTHFDVYHYIISSYPSASCWTVCMCARNYKIDLFSAVCPLFKLKLWKLTTAATNKESWIQNGGKIPNPCIYGTIKYAKGHNCWNPQRITEKEESRNHAKGLSIGSKLYASNYFVFYSAGVAPIFVLLIKSVSFP